MRGHRALLVDVGGTLVPVSLAPRAELAARNRAQLAAVLPELAPERVARLLADLRSDADGSQNELAQATDAMIAARLAEVEPALDGRVTAVRRAISAGWAGLVPPFPGHRELLEAARDMGMRVVVVSNTDFTSAEDWRERIAPALGLEDLLDGVVTSYDLGWRKPHRAMFARALEIAGHDAPACVMIGNDERKDVEPAKELGMYAIRVAIQDPVTPTRADRLVTTLEDAREALTNA